MEQTGECVARLASDNSLAHTGNKKVTLSRERKAQLRGGKIALCFFYGDDDDDDDGWIDGRLEGRLVMVAASHFDHHSLVVISFFISFLKLGKSVANNIGKKWHIEN